MIDLKVMFVEDDNVLRERLTNILSREIKEVRSYNSAASAITALDEYGPDLIITDIKMPNMTGLEMVAIIKKSFHNIPVIIASAFNETDYFLDAIKLKVDNFIIKPIDVDELLKNIQNIAEKIHAKAELKEKELLLDQYKHIVDLSAYISITDRSGIITYVNDKFCSLTGYSREELIGSAHNIIRHPDMSKAFFKNLWKTILNKQVWQGIIKNRRKDGSTFYVDTTISPILDSNGNIKEFISIKVDITDMILNKDRLERDILIDRLTELPNRLSLQAKLKESDSTYQVMLIDIDRFKDINMLFGIHFGDNVLIYLSEVLQKVAPTEGYEYFRIAADEFIILYRGEDKDALRKYVDSLKAYIENNPFEFQDIRFDIDFTAVIMQCCENGCASLENMQRAMDSAKESHQEIMLYDDNKNDDEIYKHNFKWIQKIKSALHENRLELFYQPIYNVKEQEITKYESLIRLIEPDGTVITPNFFLQAAKLSKNYRDLTKLVITQACQKAIEVDAKFSINLSIEDLADEETLSFLIESVAQYNLQHRLIAEVLESEGIDNFELIKSVLKRLKDAGLEIAIDDFGSGYSNFSYLVNLPIDILKIDGSLIKNIATDTSAKIIVQSIVMFAHELGMKCVAEFVSDKEIFETIKNLGVDLAQGYYIAQPSRDTSLHFVNEQ